MGQLVIKGKSSRLVEEFSMLTMLASGSKAPYMETLFIKMKDGIMESRMISVGNVCTVLYRSKEFELEGDGDVIINASDFIRRLKLFGSEEIITVTIEDKNVKLIGNKITSRLQQTDERYSSWLDKDLQTEGGMIIFGKTKKKPSTIVKLKGSELNSLPSLEKEVGVDIYNIHFENDNSYGFVGDLTDPSTKPIRLDIEADVEGPVADVVLAGGAYELLSSLNNETWLIGAQTNAPMWFSQQNKKHQIAYMISPMIEPSK